jgi:signal transduction histidine kinase
MAFVVPGVWLAMGGNEGRDRLMTRSARGRRTEGTPATGRSEPPERSDQAGSDLAGPADGQPAARTGRLRKAWRSFFYDRSVRARVGVLVLIPLLGALLLGTGLLLQAIERASAATTIERNTRVTQLALDAIARLQDERDVSGLYEAGGTGDEAVLSARDDTDASLEAFRSRIENLPEDDTLIGQAVRASRQQLGFLDAYRESRDIELEVFDSPGVEKYNQVIEAMLRFIKASGTESPNATLVAEIDSLDWIARATESASIERGLLAHILESQGELDAGQQQRESVSIGEQDFMLERFGTTSPPHLRADYYELMPGVRGPVEQLRNEALGIQREEADVEGGEDYPFTAQGWYQASSERIDVMRQLQTNVSQSIVEQASSAASSARTAALITAGVLVGILALTIWLAYAVARSIVRPLRRLRSAALEAADTGLPALVSRIQEDGPAVVRRIGDAVTPEGTDEIGQVASAFNEVHATAVRVAGEQALLRQNLDTIVVNLSRRTQSLVDRQLGEIEDLESRERDPDQLGTLFRIDHLATRVRRHAESLLVLAGVEEMRRQGVAAPVLDVVRTAVGEVEQYPRIKFGVMPTDLVVPSAVDDVAHLLAELLDNATEFSAPSTAVTVTSQPLLGGGLRLQVTDQGLGIPADQLAMLNERLRQPGDIDVAASRTLGIYVVARLAARHGITVRLIPAEATSGTIAQVDLPSHLIVSPLDTTDGVLQAIQPPTPRTESLLDRPRPSRDAVDPNQLPQRPTRTPPISQPAPAFPQPAVPVARHSDGGPTRLDGSEGKDDLPRTGRPDQGVRPTPGDADTRPVQPQPGDRTRQPVTADGRNSAPVSSGYQAPTPGVSPLQPQTSPLQPAMSAFRPPTARSLRGDAAGDDVPGGVSDSPIYDSVRSAWFKRGGSSDWSSPADEGWRRAAAVLRTVETVTAQPPAPVGPASHAAAGPAPVSSPARPVPSGPAIGSPSGGPGGRVGPAPWTSGGAPGPSAQPGRPPQPVSPTPPASPVPSGSPAQAGPSGLPSRPMGRPDSGLGQPGGPVPPANPPWQSQPVSASGSGLPVRQRGATLVPGSIPGAEQAAGQGSGRRADASNVASTLSNLQRGVSRGRDESGGWVPERPGDSERSNS